MNITESERNVLLEILQKLAYAYTEQAYNDHYQEFINACPNNESKNYFNENWHVIRDEWAQCFRSTAFDLGENTTNRFESFFGKIKQVIERRLRFRT